MDARETPLVVVDAGGAAGHPRPGVRARIVLSHASAAVGMSMPWPVLLDLAWSHTGDGVVLGLTGAARMLPYVLFSWWVARWADRFGRRRVVALSLVGRTGLLAAGAVALLRTPSDGSVITAVILATLAVACGTPAYPALVASLPAAGPGAGRSATSLLVTVEVSSFVVGPALGGLALGRWSPGVVLGAGAALTAVALGVFARVRLPEVEGGTGRSVESGHHGALSLLRRSVQVRGAIAAICVINLVGSGLLVALVRIADLRWGGPSAYGQATAAFGFGALAAPALFWLGRSPIRQVHLGMALFAAVLSALVPVPVTGLALVFVLLGTAGAAAVHVEAAATELLQAHVPDRIRAHLLGVTDALMVGAAMVGSFGGPVLVGWAGGGASLAVLALVTLVAGALALPIVGRRVGLPEPGH